MAHKPRIVMPKGRKYKEKLSNHLLYGHVGIIAGGLLAGCVLAPRGCASLTPGCVLAPLQGACGGDDWMMWDWGGTALLFGNS